MKVAVYTLGCKVNQFESQAMEQALAARGHSIIPFDQPADAYIVNTCSVTALSDKKSRQIARQARRQAPCAILAICGCMAQADPAAARDLGADLVAGVSDRLALIEDIERAYGGAPRVRALSAPEEDRLFEELSPGGLSGRTRALMKIEDGCDNFCAYCIIPYLRGRVRSLPPDRLFSQAAGLSDQGFQEIVLTGIEISSYGRDLGLENGLILAVEQVCNGARNARIRLGSLEPRVVTPEFCEKLAKLPNLCPHFHLSVQSGCDRTLSRMNRKYGVSEIARALSLLRTHFPGCAVMCDVIAGFPGESENDFAQSARFLESCGFAGMHVFPYSVRPGTRAARMEGQLSRREKYRRAAALSEIARRGSEDYRRGLVGHTLQVLFETEAGGLFVGHAENFIQVQAPGRDLRGRLLPVKILGLVNDGLHGEVLSEG